MKNIRDAFQDVAIKWVKNIIEKKYNDWENSYNDFNNNENNAENDPVLFDMGIAAKSQISDGISRMKLYKDKINECNNFQEIDDYLLSLKEEGKQGTSRLLNDQNSLNLDETSIMEISTLALENDVKNDLGDLRLNYELVCNGIKKIGLDTDITAVEKEDLLYILNNLIKNEAKKFQEWVVILPKAYENVSDDLHILFDENASFEDKWKHAELVEHYLEVSSTFELPSLVNNLDVTNTNVEGTENDKQEMMKSLHHFYQGIEISNSLLAVTEISYLLWNKIFDNKSKKN